jgi:hypothetical protein
MPTFIKTGFWEKAQKGYNGWLNLDELFIGKSTAASAGQVAFFNASGGITGSSNLFWDSVTNKFGVGLNTPRTPVDVIYQPFGTMVGSYNFTARPIANFYVRNGIAYVDSDSSILYIIDFRDPTSPVIISTLNGAGGRSILVKDNVLYLASTGTFDISDLSKPVFSSNTGFLGNRIGIYGTTAVYTGLGAPIRIADISNFRSVSVIATVAEPSVVDGTALFSETGRFVFIQTSTGFSTFDISNPSAPVKVASLTLPVSSAGYADIIGTYMYILVATNMYIIDVKDPASPSLVSTLPIAFTTGGSGCTVQIRNNSLFYTSNDSNKVVVYDITDRLNPIFRGSIATTGTGPRNLFVEGNLLYVTCRNSPFPIEVYSLGGTKTVGLTADVVTAGRICATDEIVSTAGIKGGALSGNNLHINGDSSIGGNLSLSGSITTRLQLGQLSMAGILPVATPSLVGGTLAAGTYYYRIVAVDSLGGTSRGGLQVSANIASGTTGSVALSWTAVSGASSYRIYRGTALGLQNVYYTSLTNSFTDTGAAVTSGTVPILNNSSISYLSNGVGVIGTSAKASYLAPTLTATGNNNVLIGLEINPTFNNGAFTNVVNAAISWTNNSGFGLYGSGTAANYLNGNTLLGTSINDGINRLQVNGNVKATQYNLSALNTAPASATATGTLGEIRIDANHIYVCTATNTWKRVAIATW